jgi:uncharacterized protein (DUF488 family)
MIKLYTIGFTEKTAEEFFTLLQKSKVKKILDVRINNISQLAGFAKGKDLAYFAKAIVGANYEHNVELAPTKELLKDYRDKKVDWVQYEKEYINILHKRNILKKLDVSNLNGTCLLCSEHKPDMCHRRLLAEYLQKANKKIEIIHLTK